MGTRNLTAVFFNGAYPVAQYGQWDGYPSGQGKTALEFLHGADLDIFKVQLGRCEWVDTKKVDAFLKEVGSRDGGLNMEQAEKYYKAFPYLGRDHGAEILEMIYTATGPVELSDSITFASDSLFCEWAYVIDLDAGKFEVYQGFNQEPVPPGQRFSDFPKDEKGIGYYPIRLIKSYDLDKLPTVEEFVAELEKDDKEEAA
jgi:hypothetical protein